MPIRRTQRWYQHGHEEEDRYPSPALGAAPAARVDADFGWDAQQDRPTVQRWFAPEAASEGLTPPTAAFDPASAAGLWQDPSGQQDLSTDRRWYAPEDDALGIPPFAITTATAAQEEAATDPDDQPQIWRDGTPWLVRTDDDVDATLPPSSAFDPAPFAGVWQEQPAHWIDSTPWASRVDDDDDDGFVPLASGYAGADLAEYPQAWAASTPWVARTDDEAEGFVPLPNAYSGFDLQEQPAFWRDSTPWVARTDDVVDASLPPTFDPASIASLWEEQPQAWADGSPWATADLPSDSPLPLPSAYAGAELGEYLQLWRDGTPWLTADELAWVEIPNLTVATVDQASPALQPEAEQRDLSVRWYQEPDDQLGAIPITTTPATVAQLAAALQPDADQPDRSQRWFQPDTEALGTPALPSALDPALLPFFGTDAGQDVSTQPMWLAPEASAEGLTPPAPTLPLDEQPQAWSNAWTTEHDGAFVPTVTTAFDPAPLAGLWAEQPGQDRSLQPIWIQPDTEIVGSSPIASANVLPLDWDAQQDRSTQPVWIQPDTEAWTPVPGLTVATIPQLAALWPDASGQQDRTIQPVWFGPEPTFDSSPGQLIVVVVTGGRGPDGGGAYAAMPSGAATAPVPGGTSTSPTPGGSATNPKPSR